VVVRAATWNLGHRFGEHHRRHQAIIATLRSANLDIVCLQEVWADEDGQDQVDLLTDALSVHSVRTPSIFWRGQSFGNAVLSRWPILESDTVALTDAKGERTPRTLLFAVIDSPFGVITCVSTHFEHRFDRSSTRMAQAAQLCAEIVRRRSNAETTFPTIVGGDLNAVPDSDEVRMITGRSAPTERGLVLTDSWEMAGDGSPGYTWARSNPHLADATWPNRRLDYLLVSWPRPKTIGVPLMAELLGTESVDGIVPSDHYGVVVDLRTG
jgi:endonuclease/exonuclease/phosphatase family metal-dependent hydrolase